MRLEAKYTKNRFGNRTDCPDYKIVIEKHTFISDTFIIRIVFDKPYPGLGLGYCQGSVAGGVLIMSSTEMQKFGQALLAAAVGATVEVDVSVEPVIQHRQLA